MRRTSILMLAAVMAFAQPSTTSIVGPIYTSLGGLYSGSFTVQAQARTNTGYAITGMVQTVYVRAGVIQAFSLVPNDTSIPNLTSYAVTFSNGDKWVCIVPTSSTPVAFTAACSPNAMPPNKSDPISISQILPSENEGDVVKTVGGIARWAAGFPAPPSSGTYCLNSINGTLGWGTCSGGGGGTFDSVSGLFDSAPGLFDSQ